MLSPHASFLLVGVSHHLAPPARHSLLHAKVVSYLLMTHLFGAGLVQYGKPLLPNPSSSCLDRGITNLAPRPLDPIFALHPLFPFYILHQPLIYIRRIRGLRTYLSI